MSGSEPERWTLHVSRRTQLLGLVLSTLALACAAWFGSTAVEGIRDSGGGKVLWVMLLFGLVPLLLLAVGLIGVVGTARSMIRPLLSVDEQQIRLGHRTVVAWEDVREITIGRVEVWQVPANDFSGNRYKPSQVVRLVLRDGRTEEWTTPGFAAPWSAAELRDGFRRFTSAIPVTVAERTEYRGGPKAVPKADDGGMRAVTE